MCVSMCVLGWVQGGKELYLAREGSWVFLEWRGPLDLQLSVMPNTNLGQTLNPEPYGSSAKCHAHPLQAGWLTQPLVGQLLWCALVSVHV